MRLLTLLGVLLLAPALLADPPPPAPAPAPVPPSDKPVVKLEAVPRSGYALITATSTSAQVSIKQVEFLVTSSGSGDITSDQSGLTLVVTLPPTGSVTVFAVALLSDGTLAAPAQADVVAQAAPAKPEPAKPEPPKGRLRVTLVVAMSRATPAEQALLHSQELRDGLNRLNADYLYADVNNPAFAKVLADAKAQDAALLGAEAVPLLFVQSKEQKPLATFRLSLQNDVKANVQAILKALGGD